MTGSSRIAAGHRAAVACTIIVGLFAAADRAGTTATAADARPQAGQPPTFRSRIDAVRVDVLVTENNKPVVGLRAGDFELYDNGVPQPINLASSERIPATVVFAFDVSESVRGQRLTDLRTAARSMLARLDVEDEAALVTFNAAVVRACEKTADRARIGTALDKVEPGGGTALVDAVYAGLTVGSAETGRVLMVVFSDGVDTSSWLSPDSVIGAAKRSNVVAYVVRAGRSATLFRERQQYEDATKRVLDSGRFFSEVADVTGGRVFDLDSTRDLEAAFARILAEFRQRYVISYVPTGVSPKGWHKLEVRVAGRPEAKIRARSGYQAK